MINFRSFKGFCRQEFPNSIRQYIVYIFLVFYFFFLFYLANNLSIWEDEAFSLSTTSYSIKDVVRLSYTFEGQPPLYFTVLALWRKINDSIFFARLFSIIFILLSAVILKKILKLIFFRYYSIGLIVLFLLNPFTIWASLEVRGYSLLLFLSMCQIYFFYKIFYFHQNQYKLWGIIIGILGVYTQYYFVFLIVSLSILLLLAKGWKPFYHYCLWALIIGIAFLPNFIFIRDQFNMHEETQLHYAWYSRISSILYSPLQFNFAVYELNLVLTTRWLLLLASLTIFSSLLFFHYKEYKKCKNQDFVSLIQVVIPFLVLLIIFNLLFSFTDLFYAHRYLTIIFPFICLLNVILCLKNKCVRLMLFIFMALLDLCVLIYIYSPPFIKGSNVKEAVRFLQKTESVHEPIIFREKSLVLVFRHYYNGKNDLVPIRNLTFNLNYYNDDLKDTNELMQSIHLKTLNKRSFIIISGCDHDFIANKKVNNKDLDEFLKNNFIIARDTIIQGRYYYSYLRIRKILRK